jgi:subtilase family serine protease
MLYPSWLGGLFDVAQFRKDRRRLATRRQPTRRSTVPRLEQLEDRVTPTGAITITNVSVVDSQGDPLATVNIGQQVYINADFTTQNLPSNASYQIAYTVNGLTRESSALTFGAGESGTQSTNEFWGTFYATPGTNQVSVTVDSSSDLTANTMNASFSAVPPSVGSTPYTVAQIRSAYGINSIPDFGTQSADGTGQTIAIVDLSNNPMIFSDVDGFDQAMSLTTTSTETLYQQYGPASSFLTVYNQNGVNITSNIGNSGEDGVPPAGLTGDEDEEAADVEWAHAIAPGALIDLIECDDSTGRYVGAAIAARLPGVSVVSMSWGDQETTLSPEVESYYDSSSFVTPSGHTGVTFLAAAGDSGIPGGYPAFSPNVVAVGASQLSLNNNGYESETAWSFPTPRTLNYGSSSYSQTGSWTTQSGGFSGTYATAAGGNSSSATWTTPISSSDQGKDGRVEVSATWVPGASNATNAEYQIYDGTASTGTLLGTVTVDQTKAPVGTSEGNTQFQDLGVFDPTSGTLTVVLSANSANGTVVADAIGIAPAWATGGGESLSATEPSWQLPFQSTGKRTSPDVAFNGSSDSPVYIFRNGSLTDFYGTSVACPCWAGLMAIVNQGRVANGLPTLNSSANPQQALQALYSLPASDFHDITSGYNGSSAAPGYDLLTGRGTPLANLLVPALVSSAAPTVATQPSNQTVTAGGSATFTASASGNPTPTVQWQVSTDGGRTFTNIIGATSTTLTLTGVTAAMNGYQYQAVFNNNIGMITSSADTLAVNTSLPPPPPTLNVPPLLALFDRLLEAVLTVNTNGTQTVTNSLFGIPVVVSIYDSSGNLVSASWLGITLPNWAWFLRAALGAGQ